MSRKAMLEQVWDLREDTDTRAIDNFIVRLRRYIEKEPARPQHLLTVRGVGYRFVATPNTRGTTDRCLLALRGARRPDTRPSAASSSTSTGAPVGAGVRRHGDAGTTRETSDHAADGVVVDEHARRPASVSVRVDVPGIRAERARGARCPPTPIAHRAAAGRRSPSGSRCPRSRRRGSRSSSSVTSHRSLPSRRRRRR